MNSLLQLGSGNDYYLPSEENSILNRYQEAELLGREEKEALRRQREITFSNFQRSV